MTVVLLVPYQDYQVLWVVLVVKCKEFTVKVEGHLLAILLSALWLTLIF